MSKHVDFSLYFGVLIPRKSETQHAYLLDLFSLYSSRCILIVLKNDVGSTFHLDIVPKQGFIGHVK